MARQTDRFEQLTADEPQWSQPPAPYQWAGPGGRTPTPSHRGASAPFGQPVTTGGGGEAAVTPAAGERPGDVFERNWRHSEERVARLQAHREGGRSFGSPQDYEDVLGPNRSGGIDTVVSHGPANTGLGRDLNGNGHAPVGARSKPSPSGGGPGMAKPVPVGSQGTPYP